MTEITKGIDKGIEKGPEAVVSGAITGLASATWEKIRNLYDEYMIPPSEHFEQYTKDCCNQFSSVKCLARNLAVMPLDRIFVPLTLQNLNNSRIQFKIEDYTSPVFNDFTKLLIIDTAGMGKTTLVKKLFLDIVNNGRGIPIFVELRRLGGNHSIIDEIISQLTFLTNSIQIEVLYHFIERGEFIFILDGYDEIALSEKEVVTSDLQDFITHTSNNRFIMTSRQVPALTSFVGFEAFCIRPLEKSEAFVLLQNYDDEEQEITSSLIPQLEMTDEYNEFLGNPLLASLVLTAFSIESEVPREKHIFYRYVYDAFFDRHDSTKKGGFKRVKYSGLDIEGFHQVLRYIGILSLKKGGVDFTKDELMNTIEQAVDLCQGISCHAGDFFNDIIETVPLFVQCGAYYRWAHESLCEYFAAQNIYRDITNKEKILIKLAKAEIIDKFINLLNLYYDIDYSSFRQSIIRDYLQQFVRYVERKKPITLDSIKRRQCAFCCDDYYFVYTTEEDAEKFSNLIDTVREKSGFSLFVFADNEEETIFAFRNSIESRNEVIANLLLEKRHPVVCPGEKRRSLTPVGLNENKLYCLDERPGNELNKGETSRIATSLMESFVHLDYNRAKKELIEIRTAISEASAFEKDLFS